MIDRRGNGDLVREHQFIPPRLVQSVILEPKYPTFNTNDGYCIRANFKGCVTTTPDGELITKGE